MPSSRVSVHRITVLSREEDRSMSELSSGHAREVTQPSCLRRRERERERGAMRRSAACAIEGREEGVFQSIDPFKP